MSTQIEQLQQLLDGELDPIHESTLFGELAINGDLRTELREQIAIKNAVQDDRMTIMPPAALTNTLFTGMGFAAPLAGAAAGAAGGSMLMQWLTRLGIPVLSAITAATLTWTIAEQPNNRITEQPNGSNVYRTANAALDMLDAVSHIISPDGSPVSVRLGVHCGPVTAGVIGTARMQYDVWGDTVNVASRMESTGEAGRIHVSEQLAHLLSSSPFPVPWSLRERGELEIKGKGLMKTYWLESTST
jgi:class 3 adenylate cyclase